MNLEIICFKENKYNKVLIIGYVFKKKSLAAICLHQRFYVRIRSVQRYAEKYKKKRGEKNFAASII